MKALLLWFVFCWAYSTGQAAPESPIEELFRRADTVWLARITAMNGGSVTVQCEELLRGKNGGEMTLGRDHGEDSPNRLPDYPLRVGSEFLLLSQGDEKRGPPRPFIGHSFESQFAYCGWAPFPITRSDNQIHVKGTLSFADHPFVEDLTLVYIKQLLDRFPYGSKFPHGSWRDKAVSSSND